MTQDTKLIVVSAVNLRKGGTLTVLRSCLEYLSELSKRGCRVVAIVHKKELCFFSGIEYIELPKVAMSWCRRLWCEYVTMRGLSRDLAPVTLWLSLHDTSPRVEARRQAVYCQTSFPFYKWKMRDFLMDYKIPLFALLTKYAYKINVRSNDYLIVQQSWLAQGLGKMLGVDRSKFIIAPPQSRPFASLSDGNACPNADFGASVPTFLFVSTPDCHKNFELLCESARLLENEIGEGRFKVVLTVKGDENRYAKWLHNHWGGVKSIEFAGLMTRERLCGVYQSSDCLVFPSKVETWGLPISEYMSFSKSKPMMLADLPYAHETASGADKVCFFNPDCASGLKDRMLSFLNGKDGIFSPVPANADGTSYCLSWEALFAKLLA